MRLYKNTLIIRKEFETELRQFCWDWSKGFWSDGYSIDSVGFAPLEVLKKYVQNQGKDCSSPLRSDSYAKRDVERSGANPLGLALLSLSQ